MAKTRHVWAVWVSQVSEREFVFVGVAGTRERAQMLASERLREDGRSPVGCLWTQSSADDEKYADVCGDEGWVLWDGQDAIAAIERMAVK